MVVGAAGDNAVPEFREAGCKGFGVIHDLLGVVAEIGLQGLLETNRLRGDDMHERSALHARKNLAVDLLGEFFFAHHKTGTRSAQALVCRRRDKVGIREWRGVHAAGDESRDVGHVHEEVCSNSVGDLAHALEIDDAGICRSSGCDHFGTNLLGLAGEGVVVDDLGFAAHTVVVNLIEFP